MYMYVIHMQHHVILHLPFKLQKNSNSMIKTHYSELQGQE